MTDTFVQIVPDKCDRIVWRNNYYHLPIKQPAAPVNHPEDGLAMVKPVIPSNSGELKPAASAEPVVSDINDLIERVLDAQQDLNLEANMQMSQTLCSVSAMLDDVEDALRRFAALAQQPSGQSQRQPDGYAYRYRSTFGDGTVIRFNRGEEVNGSRPIDAVPFWYAPPSTAQDREDADGTVILEHSGCGRGTQVEQLTVRLNPGDKVVMIKGRTSRGFDAAELAARAAKGE